MIWWEMDKKDLIYFKNRIDSIDWDIDFEKADKENYEILDRLCECIKNELMKNQKSKILPEAFLLLADSFIAPCWECRLCRGFWAIWRKFCKPTWGRRLAHKRTIRVIPPKHKPKTRIAHFKSYDDKVWISKWKL